MDKVTHSRRPARGAWHLLTGFSLTELLVVIAILGILAVVALPATSSMMRSANLNRGGQIISDQFSLARQEAVSKNQDVEVRFYQLNNAMASGWRALRIVRIETTPNGPVTNAVGRLVTLPDSVVISTTNNLSPLITEAVAQNETLASYGSVPYRAFRFRPHGGLEVGVGSNNFVTVVNRQDTASPPTTFYTIQLNPLSGKATVYRP